MHSLSVYTLTAAILTEAHTVLHRGYRDVDHAPVVVKLLQGEYPDPRELARLRHEYMILRDLDAASVVKAYGLERFGASLGLIMEDFGGRALRDILAEGELDLRAALEIAVRLAEALGVIHEHNIIHNDINPRNVFVNLDRGQVKITGFGVATRLSQEPTKTARPDAFEGTHAAYMSPEQTGRLDRIILDHRTDLYSAGVTLYEVLTGALPFPSADPMELVHSHIARLPPPPEERAPRLPQAVSSIVMKLLNKAPEERYQSAHGLKADLDECLSQWAARGGITPFALGTKDRGSELQLPRKLYGREAEKAALLGAAQRAREGRALLVLLRGPAGIGKTALVSEARDSLGQRGGVFAMGRLDERRQRIPYAAIAAVLRELVRHVLSEPEAELARWKSELEGAVFAGGKLLREFVPELTWLFGPRLAESELRGPEAQSRFGSILQGLLGVFATAEHPLALFLDDLQWADQESLQVLSLVLAHLERRHLLVIGAYRDHEVGPEHALARALSEIRSSGTEIKEISLSQLRPSSVVEILADTLGAEKTKVAPLARLVVEKTDGNPFFIGQFLKALHAEDKISFDKERGAFRWDLSRIEAEMATDNVVDLVASRIAQLSTATQRLLMLAACIGPRFDLAALSAIRKARPGQLSAELWEARKRGLVLLDGASRGGAEAEMEDASDGSKVASAVFRFSDDRVRQIAYSLIKDEDRRDAHLQIGRRLRAKYGERPSDALLFEVVAHLNIGAPLMSDRAERLELAHNNLSAGRNAKAAGARRAALGYFDAGVRLLDEGSWGDEYALTFALHISLVEVAYQEKDFHRAEAVFNLLLSSSRSNIDRGEVYVLAIITKTAQGDYDAAVRYGRACASLLGVDLPESAEAQEEATIAEMAQIPASLSGRRVEEILAAPAFTDPEKLLLLRALVAVGSPAWFISPRLYCLIVVIRVNLCLRLGRSNRGGFVYGSYAFVLACILGRYAEGRHFWELARAMEKTSADHDLRSKTSFIIGRCFHFFGPLRAALSAFLEAQRFAIESSDPANVTYASGAAVMTLLGTGEELTVVSAEIGRNIALIQRTGDTQVMRWLISAQQVIENLQGRTRGSESLSDDTFDEASFALKLEQARSPLSLGWYYFSRLMILCFHGHYEAALDAAAAIGKAAPGTLVYYFATEIPFYAGLSLAALYASADEAKRERYAALIADHRVKAATFAEQCPANYQHKHLLLCAEEARILGRSAEARELYDEAISLARANGFLHHEALANELAAQFYLSRGQDKLARIYAHEALYGYRRWGSTAKADKLAERYRPLLASPAGDPPAPGLIPATNNDGGDHFDSAAIIRAAQAIAGETVLERLLDRVMRIVVENAGADRAALLLASGERLLIEAIMTLQPDVVEVGLSAPFEGRAALLEGIVQFVQRTAEPVVIGDAVNSGSFAADPYVAAHRPRSILCLAMTHQGRLMGVLYLENRAAPFVFTPARVELSSLLASQAAVAVENARMVTELRRNTEALSSANRALADANGALGGANDALRDTNARLERELAERSRAEAAREALREELLRVQTPIIPITDGVMVMPLIGTVDAERARHVLEIALSGVRDNRAEILILDVTGVEMVGADVISTLVRTTQTLRLLGAQAVITGVRPDVARALVELRLDLTGIVTQGTLESGIAYAMNQLGKRRSPRRR